MDHLNKVQEEQEILLSWRISILNTFLLIKESRFLCLELPVLFIPVCVWDLWDQLIESSGDHQSSGQCHLNLENEYSQKTLQIVLITSDNCSQNMKFTLMQELSNYPWFLTLQSFSIEDDNFCKSFTSLIVNYWLSREYSESNWKHGGGCKIIRWCSLISSD